MRLHLMPALLSGFLSLTVTLSPAQTPVPQINYKKLREYPFETHGLLITVQTFAGSKFSMSLTNTTPSFISFAPEDMALVDKTGNQLFLERNYVSQFTTPPKLRIAPGATLRLKGYLNNSEHFPVKMYYFDTLCVIVTE